MTEQIPQREVRFNAEEQELYDSLNTGQKQAIDEMIDWFRSEKNYFFTLDGFAGTGKTFVTKAFLKLTKTFYTAKVTAPTHKAKKVISRATGCNAETLQSLLGLRPNFDVEDFNINQLQFEKLGENQMRYAKLVIIDECSMMNGELFDYIIETACREGCKVLFLGDNLQLPPIKSKKELALEQAGMPIKTISKVFTDVQNRATLSEIVRQANTNPISELIEVIRNDIQNGTEVFRKALVEVPSMLNEKGEGYQVVKDTTQFSDLAFEHFSDDYFGNNTDAYRYTAWTNDSIRFFNSHMRERMGLDTPLVEGELLMAYNSVDGGSRFAPPILTNSEDYRIISYVEGINEYGINGWTVKLRPVDFVGESVAFIVNPNDYKNYLAQHDKRLETAKRVKGKAWVNYYEFRRKNILISDVKVGNFLKVKKDIDYGYGVTVHKTQGSTYETVFINGDNIDKNSNAEECKKLWYVALSRCSKKSFILYSR